MKSYFSRLANQSALRYRQANNALRASSSEKSFREPAPLHREETIFTEPISAKVDAPQNEKKVINESPFLERASLENTSPVNETKSPSKIKAKLTENVSVEFLNEAQIEDAKSPSLPTAQNSISDKRNIYRAEQIQNEILSEKKSGESVSVIPPDLTAGEQLIIKKNEATRIIKQTNIPETQIRFQSAQSEFQSAQISFQSPQNEFQPEVSASIEVEPNGSVLSQPEYFKKTAANLEAGTADKAEIQQILLQEIYEWTSGVPAVPQAKKNEIRELNEVRVIAAQPSEATIFFEEKEAAQKAAQNPIPLKEQNFELSIGNISITVEEPPPPVQNTTVQNTVGDKRTTVAPREFSRLSRYYL